MERRERGGPPTAQRCPPFSENSSAKEEMQSPKPWDPACGGAAGAFGEPGPDRTGGLGGTWSAQFSVEPARAWRVLLRFKCIDLKEAEAGARRSGLGR
ncbi:hypothetical protein D623_10014752 [Myotis brandtii]|uniref:Uncharacterized protein n=1 Tax=Myotis brandtii TaxID=109478 RepID=S7NWN1_MYOBR|nr:hypothetical protein D623_10014752 [Myotis brandtii]